MDERTMLLLASYYDAMMQTNHECIFNRNIYMYLIIFIIIVLIIIIIYQITHPRIVYVPVNQINHHREI